MNERYKKSVETRRKNAKGNPYSEMGKKSTGNKEPWLKGNSENAKKAINARWAKYRKLKEEDVKRTS